MYVKLIVSLRKQQAGLKHLPEEMSPEIEYAMLQQEIDTLTEQFDMNLELVSEDFFSLFFEPHPPALIKKLFNDRVSKLQAKVDK